MCTKMAVAFANTFMSEVEAEILKASDKNHYSGRNISMMCFLYAVVREIKSSFLLKRLIDTTQQLNSRQKYQKREYIS